MSDIDILFSAFYTSHYKELEKDAATPIACYGNEAGRMDAGKRTRKGIFI
jgi:hypothetical protein